MQWGGLVMGSPPHYVYTEREHGGDRIMKTKSIYRISQGVTAEGLTKELIGGKAKSLVDMTALNLPVPPAFVITTEQCNAYLAMSGAAREEFMADLMLAVGDSLKWLDSKFGYRPLLSVRSGAPVSMPGMMDTILNVGLHEGTIASWENRIGARAAWDSYRRLIQMLGTTAYDVPAEVFEFQLAKAKKNSFAKAQYGKCADADLTTDELVLLVEAYRDVFQTATGKEFPDSTDEQLKAAIKAVFESWMNHRAIEYRKINNLSAEMGTAVTVQAMVFGNAGDDSGTGVLFTRDPSTGVNKLSGEFLVNAQGEDVVAGIRTPMDLEDMVGLWPEIYNQIASVSMRLEEHYRDMVDIEFTVQKGKLWILQSRVGKRSALAAFQIATDMVVGDEITVETALRRLTPEQFKAVRRPMVAPKAPKPSFTGLKACPGVAAGRPVFTPEDAVKAAAKGEKVILVRHETTPDDIAGMNAALGILTQTGGATSHAAVVARAMDKPCVTGAPFDMALLKKAKKVTLDGGTGNVWLDIEVPVIWCLMELGATESRVLPKNDSSPQTVHALGWWGNDTAAFIAVEELSKTDCSTVILDCSPAHVLTPQEDMDLYLAFGDTGFYTEVNWGRDVLGPMLLKVAKQGLLKGLTILGTPRLGIEDKEWHEAGVKTVLDVQTVADLMKGMPVHVPPAFISKVCGGQKSYETLLEALAAKGLAPQPVRKAIPGEVATFTVLAAK